MFYCEHGIPKRYCSICNTYEDVTSMFNKKEICFNCIDGTEYVQDPLGDWETKCNPCDGTGMLTENSSRRLQLFRLYYWNKKLITHLTNENLPAYTID